MLFWKRTLPLVVTFITGLIMILSFFVSNPSIKEMENTLPEWAQIVMAFTMILGAVNLMRLNIMKIQRRVEGWGYNLVLVVGFVVMAALGFLAPINPTLVVGETYVFSAMGKEATVKEIKYKVPKPAEGEEAPKVSRPLPNDGKGEIDLVVIEIEGGQVMEVQPASLKAHFFAALESCWKVIFDGVFKAASATMFSLLAFFVASASFRAFRVKSQEAALLMGTAFLVMIGNVPLGGYIDRLFFDKISMAAIKEWILNVPSSAAQSAILIGATLGYLSASLKILLGVERSYLGGE